MTPSTQMDLLEGDLFVAAGRMMGHCFLHGGSSFAGLSPAIVHVLLGGEMEMATISTADCADLEVRDVLELVWILTFFTIQ